MTVISSAELNERIEESFSLSGKANDDPDAAQALVDLLKSLQNYHVSPLSSHPWNVKRLVDRKSRPVRLKEER